VFVACTCQAQSALADNSRLPHHAITINVSSQRQPGKGITNEQ